MIDKHSLEVRYINSLDMFFKGDQDKALHEASRIGKDLLTAKLGPDVIVEIQEKEKALYEVSEIGKELVTAKLGPDVILEMHSAALGELTKKKDSNNTSKMMVDANEVLTNSLMGYAMFYYSFMDMLENEKKNREDAQAELVVERDKLKKKTAELEKNNKDLEILNKGFVMREHRLIELKKKVAELEKNAKGEE